MFLGSHAAPRALSVSLASSASSVLFRRPSARLVSAPSSVQGGGLCKDWLTAVMATVVDVLDTSEAELLESEEREFSLTAANRLARGSPDSASRVVVPEEVEDEDKARERGKGGRKSETEEESGGARARARAPATIGAAGTDEEVGDGGTTAESAASAESAESREAPLPVLLMPLKSISPPPPPPPPPPLSLLKPRLLLLILSRILKLPLRAVRFLSVSLLGRRMVSVVSSLCFCSRSRSRSRSRSTSRGRLGIRSPADCRIINSVCQPGMDCSWYVSARSCCVATRQSSASSSWTCEYGAE